MNVLSTERRARACRAIALGLLALALGEGCQSFSGTTFVGTTAASFLRNIRESRDPNVRYQSYAQLASPNCYDGEDQKIQAARTLAAALDAGREPIATRAVICRTLGALGKPEAREALIRALDDHDPVIRAEACRALGKVGKPDDALVLARIMVADHEKDCNIAAIEGIAALKPTDPRITIALVEGMEARDPAIRAACLKALRALSGKDLGLDVENWRKYARELAEKADSKPR
ncbi:MAG: HEAT repeat domain-containing protein [Isosphaeraceae bacterium]|nr:HEAT repeat domain-containing protein [Isosphaeraceae bacterium]